MVVAACEVRDRPSGLIVAIYRRRIALDVDEVSGDARMSIGTWGLARARFPLAGRDRLLAALPEPEQESRRLHGSSAIFLAFLSGSARS